MLFSQRKVGDATCPVCLKCAQTSLIFCPLFTAHTLQSESVSLLNPPPSESDAPTVMRAASHPRPSRPTIQVTHGPVWLRPVLRQIGDTCVGLPTFLQLPFLALFPFLPHALVWWTLVGLGNWSLFARLLISYALLMVELQVMKHTLLDSLDRRARMLILGYGLGAGVTAALVLFLGLTIPLLFRIHAIYAWWWHILNFVLACSIPCVWICLGKGADRLMTFVVTPAAAAPAEDTPGPRTATTDTASPAPASPQDVSTGDVD
jgi:hypothetical protein